MGLRRPDAPEEAALDLQYSVSRLELSEQVPESTRGEPMAVRSGKLLSAMMPVKIAG